MIKVDKTVLWRMHRRVILCVLWYVFAQVCCFASSQELAALKQNETVGDLKLLHLYTDWDKAIVGAKFEHVRTGAPIYFFQIQTVPQVFMWVDTPPSSDEGLAHALEHLVGGKGTKGRYVSLLKEMRLSQSAAATTDDFNLYSFSSGTGIPGFFEQLHAWLDALYRPDFTDLEAEREFYHFGVSSDPNTKERALIEEGSVYDEIQTGQQTYTYYFELNKRVLGDKNPFGFFNNGVPEKMRDVSPKAIRSFYGEHYHLGPRTGFIFALDPHENARDFLEAVSRELRLFSDTTQSPQIDQPSDQPKYPIHPSASKEIAIYPFPSSNNADRGEVRFGWKPKRTDSQTEIRLLQLFFRALADGEQSLLQKSLVDSKTRELDSGATQLESLVFLENSPFFPAEFIGLSGIPGDHINVEKVDQLRSHIMAKIAQVADYQDNSQSLLEFNRLVANRLKAWRRSQRVWLRNAPRFGLNYDTDWKEYLEYLEMDSRFVRSIADDPVWDHVEKQLQRGSNIWRDLIRKFQLLDVPYATASVPSQQLLEQEEEARKDRIQKKIKQLMDRFGTSDQQQALARFDEEEQEKTKQIDKIAARVVRPKFTTHPPLTPDPGIRYRQFDLGGIPAIATFFQRAPTIDLGLSFDLSEIPQKYYKYFPILPRTLDSLGLRAAATVVPYSDLLARIQSETDDFSIKYEFSAVSHRADLTIRTSTTSPDEFRRSLLLIQDMISSSDLELSNAHRLRDLLDVLLSEEDSFDKGGDDYWFLNPIYTFRYQNDPLYVALSSVFTQEHWDSRLRWLLHEPVPVSEIDELGGFADKILSDDAETSRKALSERLGKLGAKGLQGELVEYWKKNIQSFPESGLIQGLRQLTAEVQADLKQGPAKTIAEIRELQRLVLNRESLHIDLTLDNTFMDGVQGTLADFLRTLPARDRSVQPSTGSRAQSNYVMARLHERYRRREAYDFPLYVGFEDTRSSTANMLFLADHPGYSNLNRESLLQVLASKMVSGTGPHTFFAKTQEDGLAYGSSIAGDLKRRLISYYAGRSPDIAALIELVNSIAAALPKLNEPNLIDYALEETFPLPRSMSTFSERGRGIAHDMRDGNDPETIRRFSEAILELRHDPNLLQELQHSLLESIGPVLIDDRFKSEQRADKSVFFFVGPQRLLSDAEKRLRLPEVFRLYSSDFWMELPIDSGQRAATKTDPNEGSAAH